jgi:hypothetical protein
MPKPAKIAKSSQKQVIYTTSVIAKDNEVKHTGQKFRVHEQKLMREILNLPEDADVYWYVKDVYNGLVLLGVDQETLNGDDSLFDRYHKLSGQVYDLNSGRLVADHYGHVRRVVINSDIEYNSDNITFRGSPVVDNKLSSEREYNLSNANIYVGGESVLIRIWKWKNEVYFCVGGTLMGYNSKIHGTDITYYNLFMELWCGNTNYTSIEVELSDLLQGNAVHYFNLYHPKLCTVTNWLECKLEYSFYNLGRNIRCPESHHDLQFQADHIISDIYFHRPLIIQHPIAIQCANSILNPEIEASHVSDIPELDPDQILPGQCIAEYDENGAITDFIYNPDYNVPAELNQCGDYVMIYSDGVMYKVESDSMFFRSGHYDGANSLFYNLVKLNRICPDKNLYEIELILRSLVSPHLKSGCIGLVQQYMDTVDNCLTCLTTKYNKWTMAQKTSAVRDKVFFNDVIAVMDNVIASSPDHGVIKNNIESLSFREFKKLCQGVAKLNSLN